LYGLKQSSYEWNTVLKTEIRALGFVQSTADSSVFIRPASGTIIAVYVDDMLILSKQAEQVTVVVTSLEKTFTLRNLGPVKRFLGLEITRDASGIYINQRAYIDKLLARYGMSNCHPVKSPLDVAVNLHARSEEEESADIGDYRTLVGKLLHLAIYTRADFAYAINKLAQYSSDPSTIHLDALKRLLRYLDGMKEFRIHYSLSPSPLAGFPDASYINDHNDRKSTSGWLFMLNNRLIVFASKKQSKIVQSSTESEIIALNEAARTTFVTSFRPCLLHS
jgi:Reverse transcriptase (RNA-dependent DNA polymerase)